MKAIKSIYVKGIALLFTVSLLTSAGIAQDIIHGHIYGKDDKGNISPLVGANIIWLGSTTGTSADSEGHFMLQTVKGFNKIVISFIGFKTDTVSVDFKTKVVEHTLMQENTIEGVTVTTTVPGTHLQRLNPIQTQVITGNELKRAACCNLSESFETNASVDVSYSDAVTGAKQIQLLGLAGIYTQMQFENVPTLRGLASAYGLGYVPGPWMESIQVSKGTASVANGYESITGQINIEFKKPWEQEKMHLNLYANNLGMTEFNANYAVDVNEKVSTMILAHGSHLGNRIDHNEDNFLDHPLTTQYHLFNRWKYQGEKFESNIGVKFLQEKRLAGQVDYDRNTEQTVGNPYGIDVNTNRFEAFSKTGYIFDRPSTSLGWINAFTYHDQTSNYGPRAYNATQNSFHSNLIFMTYIGSTNHTIKSGVNFNYDGYVENLNGVNLNRYERVPGVYAEYTYKHLEMLTLMAGYRVDHHSKFGYFTTPRFHAMYKPWEQLTFRASAGKGYRYPSAVSENSNLLASNRQFVFEEDAKLEEAWNFGLNITQRYKIWDKNLNISADYYHTNFENQYIVDADRDATSVYFYNLDGKSYSNSYQIEINTQPVKGLDLTMAYRINDVKTTINGELQQKPLVSKNKGLVSISYKTPLKKWQFDYTIQLNGGGRLPNMDGYPVDVQMGMDFPSYTTMNFQLTKLFRKWDLYVGVENLTGFKQHHPIIYPENPYNQYFDASQVWGPITGAKYYAGIRISMWK